MIPFLWRSCKRHVTPSALLLRSASRAAPRARTPAPLVNVESISVDKENITISLSAPEPGTSKRPPSTNIHRRKPLPASKRRHTKVISLIHSIRHLLENKQPGHAMQFSVHRMNQRFVPDEHRAGAYEGLVHLFLEFDRLDYAYAQCQRMIYEGLAPPPSVPLALFVHPFDNPNNTDKEALESLVEAYISNISQSSQDEGFFRAIIARISRLGIRPPELLEQILALYAEKRGPGWVPSYAMASTMISAYTRARDFENAYRWIEHSENLVNVHSADPSSPPHLHRLADIEGRGTIIDPSHSEQLIDALKRMKDRGMNPTRVGYNILIASNVRNGEYQAALDHYKELQERSRPVDGDLCPDEFALSSVFKAYEGHHRAVYEHNPRIPLPPLNPSQRTMYKIFINAYPTPSLDKSASQPSPQFLTVILRSFLVTGDYAGAMYVLRLFQTLGARVPRRAYSVVVLCLRKKIIQSLYDLVRKIRSRKSATRRTQKPFLSDPIWSSASSADGTSTSSSDRARAPRNPISWSEHKTRSSRTTWASKMLDLAESSPASQYSDHSSPAELVLEIDQEPSMDALLSSLRSSIPTSSSEPKPADFIKLRKFVTNRLFLIATSNRRQFVDWMASNPARSPASIAMEAGAEMSDRTSADLASMMALVYRAIVVSKTGLNPHDVGAAWEAFLTSMAEAGQEMLPQGDGMGASHGDHARAVPITSD